MGSRPSRVRSSKVQAVEGQRKMVPPPAQKQTASAPPTPQHPEGTPRASTPSEEFPGPPDFAPTRSVTMTDAWMPGAGSSSSSGEPKNIEPAGLPGGVNEDMDVCSAPGTGYPAGSMVSPSSTKPPPAPSPAPPPPQPVVDTDLRPTTGPRGVAEGGQNDPGLDVPLEEVLKQATEAFGEVATALSSTKWDRRVQALKGIITVLKGLDIKATPTNSAASGAAMLANARGIGNGRGLQLRDHALCFHAACLILNIAMKDKVLPVLLAAHELYRVTFEHGRAAVTEAEATRAACALFPHILAKLGELNIKLHDSACACVLFTATQPFFGVPLVFAKLLDVVEGRGTQQPAGGLRGQQKMRVHYGVLQAAEMLVKQSPGRRADEGDASDVVLTWTPADVCPFIVSGLHADSVTGARVQQAAISLAMAVYTALGKSSLVSLLDQLSPAAKDMLVARLEEEGEDMEDFDGAEGDEDCIELTGADGLCIMGVGLRPHLSLSLTKPNTTDGEESLMDNILEDTGMVFGSGQALGKQDPSWSELDEELTGLGLSGLDDDEIDQLDTDTSLPELSRGAGRSRAKDALLS